MANPAIAPAAAGDGRPLNCMWSSSSSALDIESRQPQRHARRIRRRDQPHGLERAIDVQEREPMTHLHEQKRRRDPERHHVGQAVELRAKFARCRGPTARRGHPARRTPSPEKSASRTTTGCGSRPSNRSPSSPARRVAGGFGLRSAVRRARPPRWRKIRTPGSPSVNIVGKTATVRIGLMRQNWSVVSDRLSRRESDIAPKPCFRLSAVVAHVRGNLQTVGQGQNQLRPRAELDHAELVPAARPPRPASSRRRSAARSRPEICRTM